MSKAETEEERLDEFLLVQVTVTDVGTNTISTTASKLQPKS